MTYSSPLVLDLKRRLADGGKTQKHSTPLGGPARRTIDWSHRLIAWFMGGNLGRVCIIVFGRVSLASVLLHGSAQSAFMLTVASSRVPRAQACPRTMFATACSPLADNRVGNMTLLGAGSRQSEWSRDLDRVAHRSCGLPQPDSDFLDRRHSRPLSATQAAVASAEQRSRRCPPVGVNPRGSNGGSEMTARGQRSPHRARS